jgi:hypothetical protein
MVRHAIVAVLFCFILRSGIAAQTSKQASAPDWSDLKYHIGDRVVAVLAGGHEVRGKLDVTTDRDLNVDGKRFLKEQVIEVYTSRKDSAWTGAGLGAVIGFGAGVGMLAAMKAGGDDWAWSDGLELFGPVGAAIGSPTGYLVDRSRQHKQVLYRAR